MPELVDAASAVARINADSRILIESGAAEPTVLTSALRLRAGELGRSRVISGLLLGGYEPFTTPGSQLILDTWFPPGMLAEANIPTERFNYLPLSWRQVDDHLRSKRFDVALIQVSPANAQGVHSMGISASFTRTIVEAADLVIAQVNQRMPFTPGDSEVRPGELDLIVEVDEPLLAWPSRGPSAIDVEIASLVAGLVPNGATIQLGIGGTPAAVVDELVRRGGEGFSVVSQLSDATLRLIAEAGDPSRRSVIGEIGGTQALYERVPTLENISMASAGITHQFAAGIHRAPFVAINSALEVDLFGQVNTEFVRGEQFGLIGGGLDFAMITSAGGPSHIGVIAMPARTNSGASRVVANLSSPVSIPRAMTQVVVTEYGIADLRGTDVHQRRERMASIAHPDDRARLLANK